MLSKKTLGEMIVEYDELLALSKEVSANLKKLEDGMKGEMDRRGVDVLEVGNRVVRWTPYVSQRFDSTGFRKAEPEMYQAYIREVKGHRFSVS